MPINEAANIRIRSAREIKRAPVAISSISDAGVFEGYASLFEIVDLGRDLVLPGAFRETLARRGAGQIKMLWQHEAKEAIGAWLSIEEDARGLKVKGRLNLAVARAREVLALMRDGTVDGLSIGYRTEKSFTDKMTGVRRLQKLDLWEISIVTFPMLPQARVSSLKRRIPLVFPSANAMRKPSVPVALLQAKYRIESSQLEIKFLRLARAIEAKGSAAGNAPLFPGQGHVRNFAAREFRRFPDASGR